MTMAHKFASFQDKETGHYVFVELKMKQIYEVEIINPNIDTEKYKGKITAKTDQELNFQLNKFYKSYVQGNKDIKDKPYLEVPVTVIMRKYNPEYGDERICECGHSYYRHFDSYDDNAPVGCKYCLCDTFIEKNVDRDNTK